MRGFVLRRQFCDLIVFLITPNFSIEKIKNNKTDLGELATRGVYSYSVGGFGKSALVKAHMSFLIPR